MIVAILVSSIDARAVDNPAPLIMPASVPWLLEIPPVYVTVLEVALINVVAALENYIPAERVSNVNVFFIR